MHPICHLITILLYFSRCRAQSEVCCNLAGIGCFDKNPPFNGLPLPWCQELEDVNFMLFTKQNKQAKAVTINDSLPSDFDATDRTVFVTHGFQGSGSLSWIKRIKDNLLKKGDYNVITVSWKKGASLKFIDYVQAASNTRVVGAMTAKMMEHLVAESGTTHAQLWCVGFSLGAHVCGHAGMRTTQRIGRVTGLDPAGPYFENMADEKVGLNPTSALLVDVIHTDTGGTYVHAGTKRPLGHMDFYPNGMGNQPGCFGEQFTSTYSVGSFASALGLVEDLAGCSHNRAHELFVESIIDSSCLVATQNCSSWTGTALEGCRPCNEGKCPVLGMLADNNISRGIFYLKTRACYPYCITRSTPCVSQKEKVLLCVLVPIGVILVVIVCLCCGCGIWQCSCCQERRGCCGCHCPCWAPCYLTGCHRCAGATCRARYATCSCCSGPPGYNHI